MAKNGFKIFDTDTHVGPYIDVLEQYLTEAEKAKLASWEQFKSATNRGYKIYAKGQRHYRRRLGAADPQDTRGKYMAGFTGAHGARKPHPRVDYEADKRIEDMDYEGVDVNLTLPSGWFGTWTAGDDVELEMGMYRAYHRWMEDYCKPYPDRIGGVILACARDIPGSLEEIKRWGKSRWAWGVMVYAPAGMPLDHPQIEPVWALAQDLDLSVALHTFTESWTSWERHPLGDETVICTSGEITLIQELPDGPRKIDLRAGDYAVNPRGVWHTADVSGRATALFITAGRGTEHRPR